MAAQGGCQTPGPAPETVTAPQDQRLLEPLRRAASSIDVVKWLRQGPRLPGLSPPNAAARRLVRFESARTQRRDPPLDRSPPPAS